MQTVFDLQTLSLYFLIVMQKDAIHIDMHYTFIYYPLRVVQNMPSKYALVMFTE